MDRVRDGIEESEDVGKTIAEMGTGRVDDVEIQEEFDEMLKAEEEKEKVRQAAIQKEKEERETKEKRVQELLEKQKQRRLQEEAEKKEDGLMEDLKSVSLESLEPLNEEVNNHEVKETSREAVLIPS